MRGRTIVELWRNASDGNRGTHTIVRASFGERWAMRMRKYLGEFLRDTERESLHAKEKRVAGTADSRKVEIVGTGHKQCVLGTARMD